MTTFESDFLKDVPRGVPSRYVKEQSLPKARFILPEQITSSAALSYFTTVPGGKIMLGRINDRLIGIEDNRHVLTVAGSRTGKSVSLINNLFFYRGSVLATDLKGELATITALARKRLGQKVVIVDPFNVTPESVAGFRASYNPLSVLTLGNPTIIEDAELIADAMVIRTADSKDPHWDDSAKNLIEGVILHVATSPVYDKRRNLLSVREVINRALEPDATFEVAEDEAPPLAIEEEMLANAKRLMQVETTEEIGRAIDGAARDFYDKSDRERDSVLSTARRHTKFLDYRSMRKVLCGHDFDLADLKRRANGMTIYLCFPATRVKMSNRWLRIFVNQFLCAMEREKIVPHAPVLAALDEFPVLGYMSQLEDAVGQIASFHVKLWVFLQDWGQGKALYGDRWESFAANAGVMQFFGNADLTTTEYISKRLGKTPVEVTRRGEVSANQAKDGLSGQSESLEMVELLTPDEVTRMFARNDRLKRQLILWNGYHPMILQRVEYFDAASPVAVYFGGKR